MNFVFNSMISIWNYFFMKNKGPIVCFLFTFEWAQRSFIIRKPIQKKSQQPSLLPFKNAKRFNYGNLFFFFFLFLLLLLLPLFFFINKTSHKLYVTTLIKDPRALTVFIDRKKKKGLTFVVVHHLFKPLHYWWFRFL